VSITQVREFIRTKRGVVVDARPAVFHRLGHLPGAVSLPKERLSPASIAEFAGQHAAKAIPLIVYCSDAECDDAQP
jgi:rhodanese-related sulfurtransferase